MKIKITRNTVADGHPVFVGDAVEVTETTGRLLLEMGKAELYVPEPTPAPEPEAPAPEVAEKKPAPRRRATRTTKTTQKAEGQDKE